ncbi:MAG TPA: Uma2 family endonuclease [Pyrinomonadaceae bacterium]|nr:Uma2 family endonuclease [Pyrinomonadaceae bacterium]
MSTTTQSMTADELLKLPRGRFRYELIKGELITMSPAGSERGALAAGIAALLVQYVRANKLGIVFGAETGFKIAENPDTVLAPDTAFISRENIPESGIPKKYWPGAPDLAVEVLSPGDTAREVEVKVGRWLSAGARLVWTINPKHKSVTVYRAAKESDTLSETDELDGEDVVPGFRCQVSEIFAGI